MIMRSLFKISRKAMPLLRVQPRFYFAVEAAKKIPNEWDLSPEVTHQLGNALINGWSCEYYADLLKDNFQFINDHHISFALQRIYDMDLELDDHFYEKMVPLIKDFSQRFTRDHSRAFGQIVAYCGYLNVQDDKLWELFEDVLLKKRIYRYVPLNTLVTMVHGISQSSYGSQELLATCESVVVRHRLALTEENRQQLLEAYQKKDYKSPILYKMLENPSADFEAEMRSQQKQLQ